MRPPIGFPSSRGWHTLTHSWAVLNEFSELLKQSKTNMNLVWVCLGDHDKDLKGRSGIR